jgi:hypothetical protein
MSIHVVRAIDDGLHGNLYLEMGIFGVRIGANVNLEDKSRVAIQ